MSQTQDARRIGLSEPDLARETPTPWPALALPSLRNALLALFLGLIGASGAAALVLKETPVYRSSAVLLINQPGVIAASGDAGVLVKLNAVRQKYVALVPTRVIAGRVAQRLGISQSTVAKDAAAFAPAESLIMFSAARTPHPGLSRRIAEAVAQQIEVYADAEQASDGVPAGKRIEFTIVQDAQRGARVAPVRRRALTVAAFTGLAVLAGAYVLPQLVMARRRQS